MAEIKIVRVRLSGMVAFAVIFSLLFTSIPQSQPYAAYAEEVAVDSASYGVGLPEGEGAPEGEIETGNGSVLPEGETTPVYDGDASDDVSASPGSDDGQGGDGIAGHPVAGHPAMTARDAMMRVTGERPVMTARDAMTGKLMTTVQRLKLLLQAVMTTLVRMTRLPTTRDVMTGKLRAKVQRLKLLRQAAVTTRPGMRLRIRSVVTTASPAMMRVTAVYPQAGMTLYRRLLLTKKPRAN